MKKKVAELKVCSRYGVETSIASFFTAFVAGRQDDQKRLAQIRIAIHEACINAIEHGNKKDESKWIYSEIFEADDFFEIVIIDEGESFYIPDPKTVPTREEMEKKIEGAGRRNKNNRGMGRYFMFYFADEVTYEKNKPHGTKVILKLLIKQET